MNKTKKLKLTADTYFRPGTGNKSSLTKEIYLDTIDVNDTIHFEFFNIFITQKTDHKISGEITWQYDYLSLSAGLFTINEANNSYTTEYLNVSYDTHVRLSIDYIKHPTPMNIQDVILNIDDSARIQPPASVNNIEKCNKELLKSGAHKLPLDFVDFLKTCNGLEFNGMQIFGTGKNEIIHYTIQHRNYYERFDYIQNLIFFGRIDDDLYTYNALTKKYESRDICSFDIWDEYNDFEEFFSKEMMKWLV